MVDRNSEFDEKVYATQAIKEFVQDYSLTSIEVKSAGFDGKNIAEVLINDVPVEVSKNKNDHYRGLHLVIIDPTDGEVLIA